MSSSSQDPGIPPEMRAKLAAAIARTGLRLNLDRIFGPPPATRARQTVPNTAKPCHPAAPTRKLQNEPTAAAAAASPPPPPYCDKLPNEPTDPPTPMCQSAPNGANTLRDDQNCKTNPPPSPRARPLTPDQLRAARLLVAGHSTNDTAAALQINRHTLARWKRLPLFQRELRELVAADDGSSR